MDVNQLASVLAAVADQLRRSHEESIPTPQAPPIPLGSRENLMIAAGLGAGEGWHRAIVERAARHGCLAQTRKGEPGRGSTGAGWFLWAPIEAVLGDDGLTDRARRTRVTAAQRACGLTDRDLRWVETAEGTEVRLDVQVGAVALAIWGSTGVIWPVCGAFDQLVADLEQEVTE